jgi:hypothetical protein
MHRPCSTVHVTYVITRWTLQVQRGYGGLVQLRIDAGRVVGVVHPQRLLLHSHRHMHSTTEQV